jgi:two-component system, NtrC family, response regulator AtoC
VSRILIVEDEALIRSELRRLLVRAGHDVAEAGSVPMALAEQAPLDRFDLVITDLRLPGPPGTELIAAAAPAPVVVMTSYATVRSAVDAMKLGAVDYVSKPFDHDEILIMVERVLAKALLERQVSALRASVERDYPVAGMVGRSQAMRDVFERIRKVAPTEATVLVRGESGTGKELVARALHEQSPRKNAPLVVVNCAAIPESLMESELFGHEKGAFTGATQPRVGLIEAADGGTLFLDEIGELPVQVQARLLRVLQESEVRRVGGTRTKRVDVRIVAATHRDLPQMVKDGAFRSDLYFRLRVFEVLLPALRDRPDDVPPLAEHLFERALKRFGKRDVYLGEAAWAAIRAHRWPGNVRELDNALERAVILCDQGAITPELLALEAAPDEASAEHDERAPASEGRVGSSLLDYFRRFVLEHQHALSETELAKRLGISRKALWERRARLGLPRPKPKD